MSDLVNEDVVTTLFEMSEGEARECLNVGQDLARRAAENHAAAVEDAHSRLRTQFEECRSAIAEESSNKWAVTVRNEELSEDKWVSAVALTEMDGDVVLGYWWEIAVETQFVMEPHNGKLNVGYRTGMRAVVEGLEEMGLPEGAVLAEIAAPQFVGTVIG